MVYFFFSLHVGFPLCTSPLKWRAGIGLYLHGGLSFVKKREGDIYIYVSDFPLVLGAFHRKLLPQTPFTRG